MEVFMRAIFIGEDGSRGFKYGQTYELNSDIRPIHIGGKIFGQEKTCICLFDRNSKAWCPYSSLEKILENWRFLQVNSVQ